MIIKFAIFASGAGTNFVALAKAFQTQQFGEHQLLALICNNPTAPVIQAAKVFPNIKIILRRFEQFATDREWEEHLVVLLTELKITYILLAGYMLLVSDILIKHYPDRIINLHPSLLPKYRGLNAIQRAWDAKEQVTGITLHIVNHQLDAGLILYQATLKIDYHLSFSHLVEKVHALEYQGYHEVVQLLCYQPLSNQAVVSLSDYAHSEQLVLLIKQFKLVYATDRTHEFLVSKDIKARPIQQFTTHPNYLDGRVKTLHYQVFASILALPHNSKHQAQLANLDISQTALVIVNFYDFHQAWQNNTTWQTLLSYIDIGGPTMARSAAKNYCYTTIILDPQDYQVVNQALKTFGFIPYPLRCQLAIKAFQIVSTYDQNIANYFQFLQTQAAPQQLSLTPLTGQLRYGENPHQAADSFSLNPTPTSSVLTHHKLHGKSLSYNNILDANTAFRIYADFSNYFGTNIPFCAIGIKHNNPCGLAFDANSLTTAWNKCYQGDKISIYGGIVLLNNIVDLSLATILNKLFLEIIMAPAFSPEALQLLKKKPNLILIKLTLPIILPKTEYRWTNGTVLEQTLDVIDSKTTEFNKLQCMTLTISDSQLQQLHLAWIACKNLKSNAIVVWDHDMMIGYSCGFLNRYEAIQHALQCNPDFLTSESILASDGFLARLDNLTPVINSPIKTIVHPGGSKFDQVIIDECNKLKISLYVTNRRHFAH